MRSRIASLFRNLWRQSTVEQALSDELQSSLELLTEEKIEQGLSPSSARRQALMELGGVEQVKEEVRAAHAGRFLEDLARDVRLACRTLAKGPGFTAVAVITLALGIGANTAVFSVLDALLLRWLPVTRPQELALLSTSGPWPGSSVGSHAFSYPAYRALREHNGGFEDLMCRFRFAANVGGHGETQRVTAELVSGNYFELLGVPAAIGRTIGPDDARQPGQHPVAVLSYSYWMTAFGGDRSVLGTDITVNGQPLTVIGVSAKGFDGVEPDFTPQVRVPVTMVHQMVPFMSWITLQDVRARWVQVFGRLKPGVSREQARAALEPLYHSVIQDTLKGEARGSKIEVLPGGRGTSFLRLSWSTPLWALMAMVSVVLLLACVNIASLLIGRGLERQGEIALRIALGAQRRRVVAQLVTEGAVLAAAGGVLGILLAPMTSRFLVQFITTPEGVSGVSPAIDWRALLFCLAATVGSTLLFALLPAVVSTRPNLLLALKQAFARGSARGRVRMVLVGVQVTLSLVLLIASALFVRSLRNLSNIHPGFETGTVVAFGVDPLLNGYTRERAEETYQRLKERLEGLPGTQSAALGLVRVLGGDTWDNGVSVEGYQPKPGDVAFADNNAVSADYFRTLGIPLVAGRDFTARDRAGAPPVAIVNESFVRRYLKGGPVLGRRVGGLLGPDSSIRAQIVGVVKDARYETMRGDIPPQTFIHYPQLFTVLGMNVYVRGNASADQTMTAIRRAVAEVDPSLAVYAMRTLDQQRDRSLGTDRMIALLATAFGGLATLLVAIGLYGVLNYDVTRRTRELGIRVAMGAQRASVVWLVLRRGLLLLLAGACAAIPIALASGRLIASQLAGIDPSDPGTILSAVLFLALVTVVAAAPPARRAAKLDPIRALRYE
jgi:predicted permease